MTSEEGLQERERDWLAKQFEASRPHLRAVAYRLLGSLSDADDAVQESWLRLSRSDAGDIENLKGWLTTVVGRVSLNMLREKNAQRQESVTDRVPDPILSRADSDPEQAAILAESVGLALLVVLEALDPDERLAFVLHDMFAVPFDEIGAIVGRSAAAARQLASRARRRVRGSAPTPDADPVRQREVANAFLAAARDGDLDALVAVLHPDVVLRVDTGTLKIVRGSRAVAHGALAFARLAQSESAHPILVNGSPGFISWQAPGQLLAVLGFTIVRGQIVEIDILRNPARLRRLDLTGIDA